MLSKSHSAHTGCEGCPGLRQESPRGNRRLVGIPGSRKPIVTGLEALGSRLVGAGREAGRNSSRAGARLAQPPPKVRDGVEADTTQGSLLPRRVEGAADGSPMLPATR